MYIHLPVKGAQAAANQVFDQVFRRTGGAAPPRSLVGVAEHVGREDEVPLRVGEPEATGHAAHVAEQRPARPPARRQDRGGEIAITQTGDDTRSRSHIGLPHIR